jgi:hypothetical protein
MVRAAAAGRSHFPGLSTTFGACAKRFLFAGIMLSATDKHLPTLNGKAWPYRYQGGQAMVFTLVFGVATLLVALMLFNSGMLANTKTKLQNAADAGAYSAGVLQARDHNFSAYANRAMVANQVAVLQLVSLKSFVEDANNTHTRMDGFILSLEAMIPTSTTTWDNADNLPVDSVNSLVADTAPIAVQGLDALIHAFQVAQDAHHLATVLDMVLAADEVVKKNDPDASITKGAFSVAQTAVEISNWSSSTKQHRANDDSAEADRFADVVVSDNSTDAFSRARPSTPTAQWHAEVNLCNLLPNYVASHTDFAFAHDGGSILSADKKRWLALDATMGGGVQWCTTWEPCFTGICYTTESTPLVDDNVVGGSGGGVAGDGGQYQDAVGYHGNPASTRRFGEALVFPLTILPAQIRYNDGPGSSLDSSGGLQDYYRDMADPTTAIPKDQTAEENGGKYPITIEVEHAGANIRTSTKVLPDSSRLKLADGMQGNTMRALSSAHAFFYRPKTDDANSFTRGGWQRGDNKTEMADLFSPYWQARLVDRTVTERTASWVAQ